MSRNFQLKNKILEYLRAHPSMLSVPYWLAALATGLVAVAYTKIFAYAEHIFEWAIQQHSILLFVLSPLCFLLGWWIVFRFAPAAQGSGVPQVIAAIELGETRPPDGLLAKLLDVKIIVIKIVSSSLCVLGGGAVGREGPTIQIAGIIFYWIGRKFQKIWHNFNIQTWLIAGGAAGVAAAFNTPLGGIVYAIEELSNIHFARFKGAIISGVIISGLVAQWILGSYLYVGYPKLNPVTVAIFPLAVFIGLVSGAAGSYFGKILTLASEFRRKITSARGLAFFAVLAGLIIATTAYFLGSQGVGSGQEILLTMLFDKTPDLHSSVIIVRMIAPIVSFFSGCAGGLYAPALGAGGVIGYFLAGLVKSSYINSSVLLGMIGFLTGLTRAPFTAFVLVLEMTDRHSAIFPMMLTAAIASSVARLVERHSFYHNVTRQILEGRAHPAPDSVAETLP